MGILDESVRAIASINLALFALSFILSLFLIGQVRPYLRALDWIVRGVLAIDFALFVALFIPAYSGIGQRQPGFGDRLWGYRRLDNFGLEFVWVCASTLFIALASAPFTVVGGVTETKERHYHRTAILCLIWLACFLVYFVYSLLNSF